MLEMLIERICLDSCNGFVEQGCVFVIVGDVVYVEVSVSICISCMLVTSKMGVNNAFICNEHTAILKMNNVLPNCGQFSQCSYWEEVIKLDISNAKVNNSIIRNEPITDE